MPLTLPPKPIIIWRSARSEMSTTRFILMLWMSIPSLFFFCRWVSNMAQSKLLAAPTAWISPVKWRFKSSMGTTWEYPPPAAPPLIPKTGPIDGSRRVLNTFLPILARPWPNPMEVTVLPSPKGVGVTAVTTIYLPWGLSLSLFRISGETLALYFP